MASVWFVSVGGGVAKTPELGIGGVLVQATTMAAPATTRQAATTTRGRGLPSGTSEVCHLLAAGHLAALPRLR